MVTARQVAESLGVSISTVGRALADDPRISRETKARVREAANSVGYVENGPAQMMRGGVSKMVGLILPDIQNSFYATIAQALSGCFDQDGFHLALSIADDDRDIEARHVRDLVSARVAGILIVPTASPRRETLAMLSSMRCAQILRRSLTLETDWFGIDDEECIRTATRHLIDLGHRRIAYVGGAATLSTGTDRLRGFRRAFVEAGVDGSEAIEALGTPTAEFGELATRRLLSGANPPTAMISGAVRATTGILETVSTLGLSVPSQLSIVGFGDPPWFKWWGPGLTTVGMPIQDIATSCGLWFLHGLKSKLPQHHPHVSTMPAVLVTRGSTAKPKRS